MGGDREAVVTLDDGAQLWTATSGAGAPVVLCHGGPGLWDYLGPLAALLGDGLELHRFDQRGCGRSTGHGPYSITQAVEDLEEVRAYFGHRRWSLIGHSWGAELVLRYAAAYPRATARVVYVSGVGAGDGFRVAHDAESARRLGPQGLRRLEVLKAQVSRTDAEDRELCLLRWRPDYSPSGEPEALASAFWELRPPGVDVNQRANKELWADRFSVDLLDLCRGIASPVLLVHGQDDPRPVSYTDEILAALPHSSRVVIPAAGHSPWAEQPAETSAAVRKFLRA